MALVFAVSLALTVVKKKNNNNKNEWSSRKEILVGIKI